MTEQEQAERTAKGLVIFGFVALLIATPIVLSSLWKNMHRDESVLGESTGFTATVTPADIEVLNPTTVQLNITIRNDGDKAAKPSCNIEAGDETNAYHGRDYIVIQDKIEPGQSKTTVANLTITNQGAAYVKAAVAKCK